MVLRRLKPADILNTGPITINTHMYIDIIVGPRQNLYARCSRMSLISLMDVYILFKRLVQDEGIELPDVGYLRLFQILTEIILVMWGDMDDNHDTIPDDDSALYNEVLRESIIEELTHEIHQPMLSELSCDDDTIVEILQIVEQIKLSNIVRVYRLPTTVLIPNRWSGGGDVLLLHTLDYKI